MKNVDTDEYIALKDGRTLVLKFCIEEGALGGGPAIVQMVSGGGFHTCAINTAGAAFCWGDAGGGGRGAGDPGQLGDGTGMSSATPVSVVQTTAEPFRAISAGTGHSCAIGVSGAAYCWGDNRYGQLGTGDNTSSLVPIAVNSTLEFESISAGLLFTCAVTTSGVAYCWGQDAVGTLGIGTGNTDTCGTLGLCELLPTLVDASGVTFTDIAAGRAHACAVAADGTAYCWGVGEFLGGNNFPFPPNQQSPQAVVGATGFVSVDVGSSHGCGITAGNDLYCWGSNGNFEIGAPVMGSSGAGEQATFVGSGYIVATTGTGYSCGVTAGSPGPLLGTRRLRRAWYLDLRPFVRGVRGQRNVPAR